MDQLINVVLIQWNWNDIESSILAASISIGIPDLALFLQL